jgi:hypothetical protein
LSWSILSNSLEMNLLPCPLRKKYFTITLCSIRSIQIFITYVNASIKWRSRRSSAPEFTDNFSGWTRMIDLEIDLVSRMLFGYWQFSVLKMIGRGSGTFPPLYNHIEQSRKLALRPSTSWTWAIISLSDVDRSWASQWPFVTTEEGSQSNYKHVCNHANPNVMWLYVLFPNLESIPIHNTERHEMIRNSHDLFMVSVSETAKLLSK